MRIAVFGKSFSEEALPFVVELLEALQENEIEVCINQFFVDFISGKFGLNLPFEAYTTAKEITNPIDFLISIGGDGTILDTITSIRDTEVPIVGFNTGRLGFLANNPKEEASSLIQKLVNNEYTLEQRTLLEFNTKEGHFGNNNFALNELTVHKKDSSSMITIKAFIDDLYLNTFWADGLLIATPTGSTAYSLSCGGPIIVPQSANFVITPIAPHNLSVRPIVLPDSATIKLVVDAREEEVLASLDSRSESIDVETELIIKKADFKINLVQFKDQNFFKTIRNKLQWGADKRN